ncbi:MAG: Fic family protein [Luteolibacter sp.]
MNDFSYLSELKSVLDEHRPLNGAVVANLREDLIVRWTYNSNAIEGNTLTLRETKVALEGITVGGKSLQEHLEVVNHRDAIVLMEDFVKKNELLDEWTIKSLHALILKGIDNENAGTYRSVNVRISGADHLAPDQLVVPELMEAFIHWYQTEGVNLHPVERAARVHSDFVKIHPFVDGNGRTSRLLMNLELLKSGYPAAVLPVERRLEYYAALDEDHTRGNKEPFLKLISETVEESFAPYWHGLSISAPTRK